MRKQSRLFYELREAKKALAKQYGWKNISIHRNSVGPLWVYIAIKGNPESINIASIKKIVRQNCSRLCKPGAIVIDIKP